MPPKKTFNPLAARIKRMMQKDDDVGKVKSDAPVVLARALELFVKQLVTTTHDVAMLHAAKIIGAVHLKGAIAMVPEAFDFLADVTEGVADLPPPPDLSQLEAELKAKAEPVEKSSGGGSNKRRKGAAVSGDLGGSLELGDFGSLGGGSLEAGGAAAAGVRGKKRAKTTKKSRSGSRKRAVKKEISDEEDDFEDMSDTEEEYDAKKVVVKRAPTRSRSGRVIKKKYVDDDDSDFEAEEEADDDYEEEEKPIVGSLGGGSLDFGATAEVGADEDDYD
jgi:hypothetical protein